MYIINGKRFAKDDSEFVDSLFTGEPVIGFYKVMKHGIRLYDHQKRLFAFVVIKGRDRFLVDACMRDGKAWYSFGASSATYAMLGAEEYTFASDRSLIDNAVFA